MMNLVKGVTKIDKVTVTVIIEKSKTLEKLVIGSAIEKIVLYFRMILVLVFM